VVDQNETWKGGEKMTDCARLQELVKSSGIKKSFIAEKMGISYQGYVKKESGKSQFLANEIAVLKDVLRLSNKEVAEIFLS